MTCKHKNYYPLYAKTEKSWISPTRYCDEMIYICKDCGAVLVKAMEQKRTLKLNMEDKKCKV